MAAKTLTFSDLAEQRRKTETISKFLQDQLVSYLETLRPLLAPEKLLGRYAGSRFDVPHADRALGELEQSYAAFTTRPFDLPREFEKSWVAELGSSLELHRWGYRHDAASAGETKPITMTHPARWILSYKSGYSVSDAKQSLTSKEHRRTENLRQFVVAALVLNMVVSRNPGLSTLFAGLRYELRTEEATELPKLPLVTISSTVPAFRPADDLILAAAGFSGIGAFIELIDLDAIPRLQDPLRSSIESLLGSGKA